MDEADRIRTMRDEGKIDDAQAQRLIAAVEAIAAAENDAPASAQAPASPATTGVQPDAHGTAQAAAGSSAGPSPTPPPSASQAAADQAGTVDRWIDIQMFACAIDIDVDPTATSAVATSSRGDVTVEDAGDGWKVKQGNSKDGTWLERLVSGVNETRLHVTVPPRTGVRLDVKAGDVDLDGVPALTGTLMAGDLDAKGLRAVDLNVKAGDIDLELDPLPGRHVVRLAAGDLTVTLPEHADVRVDGHVSIGDASAFAPIASERNGIVAASLHGVLGEGRGVLDLKVGTGDLDVRRANHGK